MFEKLSEYVHGLFQNVPRTTRNLETQEQLIADLQDRYTDLVAEGVPPEEAYLRAIDSIGDLSEVLETAKGESAPQTSAGTAQDGDAGTPPHSAGQSQDPWQNGPAYQAPPSYAPDDKRERRRRHTRSGCIAAFIILLTIGMIASISMEWASDFVGLRLLEDLAAIPFLLFAGIGTSVLVFGLTATRPSATCDPSEERRRRKRSGCITAAIILVTIGLIGAISMEWVASFTGLAFLYQLAAIPLLLFVCIAAAVLVTGLTATRAPSWDAPPPAGGPNPHVYGADGQPSPGGDYTAPGGYGPDGAYNQPYERPPKSPLYAGLHSALWSLATLVYLIVSFTTHAWYITWVIFLCAVAVQALLHLILEGRHTTSRRVRGHINTILWMSCLIAFFCLGFWAGGWPWAWLLFPLAVCIQQIVRLSFLWRETR